MNKEFLQIDMKTLKSLKIFIILLDILAGILLVLQIKMNSISYALHILLILLNIIIFILKPKKS